MSPEERKKLIREQANAAFNSIEHIYELFFTGRREEAFAVFLAMGLHDQLMFFSYLGSHMDSQERREASGLTRDQVMTLQQYILQQLNPI